MLDSNNRAINQLISKLSEDKEHYARRKIILPDKQQLVAIGQLSFVIYPIQYENGYFHINMLLPKQLMTVTTRQKHPDKN